ncbi:MAG: hypothetical protein ACJ77K_04155 [Bacteroidia bacterium]
MYYRELIKRSAELYKKNEADSISLSVSVFQTGAQWMQQMMKQMDEDTPDLDPAISFSKYGTLKYTLCLLAFFVSAFLFYKINRWLLPLSVLIFYMVEIQFLFLFPVLISRLPNPVSKSIQMTFETGTMKAIFTVIPIAAFMLTGLFNLRNPYRNWHIGSLAILIWYSDEVKNRN